jgi:hypothetical protein
VLAQCVFNTGSCDTGAANELSALKIIYKERFVGAELNVIKSEANILQKLIGKEHIVQLKNVRT